jgi:hypothetical protein
MLLTSNFIANASTMHHLLKANYTQRQLVLFLSSARWFFAKISHIPALLYAFNCELFTNYLKSYGVVWILVEEKYGWLLCATNISG